MAVNMKYKLLKSREIPVTLVGMHFIQSPVPTQVIIGSKQKKDLLNNDFQRYGRGYFTRLYNFPYGTMTWHEYREECEKRNECIQGTSGSSELMLVEVFDDEGEDGHTYYNLKGFILIPLDEWKKKECSVLMEDYIDEIEEVEYES